MSRERNVESWFMKGVKCKMVDEEHCDWPAGCEWSCGIGGFPRIRTSFGIMAVLCTAQHLTIIAKICIFLFITAAPPLFVMGFCHCVLAFSSFQKVLLICQGQRGLVNPMNGWELTSPSLLPFFCESFSVFISILGLHIFVYLLCGVSLCLYKLEILLYSMVLLLHNTGYRYLSDSHYLYLYFDLHHNPVPDKTNNVGTRKV